MNADAWGNKPQGAYMSDPQWYAAKGYPTWKEWPHGEALWTGPLLLLQQRVHPPADDARQDGLLGYLYSLGETHVPSPAAPKAEPAAANR